VTVARRRAVVLRVTVGTGRGCAALLWPAAACPLDAGGDGTGIRWVTVVVVMLVALAAVRLTA
jgi:hypothetical protein